MTEEMRVALTEIFNQSPQPRHLRSRADRLKNGTLQLASAVRVLQDNGYTVTITIVKSRNEKDQTKTGRSPGIEIG